MSRLFALILPVAALAFFAFFTGHAVRADETTPATQPTGYSVTLTVTDASGSPVVGANVTLTAAAAKAAAGTPKVKGAKANASAVAVGQGVTDSNGKVVLSNIPTGNYSAAVVATDGATGKKKVAVTDADVTLKVKMKAAKTVPATQPAA